MDVTIRCHTDVIYLTWPWERLHLFLSERPSVKAAFDSLVGADVARKLLRQKGALDVHTLASQPGSQPGPQPALLGLFPSKVDVKTPRKSTAPPLPDRVDPGKSRACTRATLAEKEK
jgi:hypothetical protein